MTAHCYRGETNAGASSVPRARGPVTPSSAVVPQCPGHARKGKHCTSEFMGSYDGKSKSLTIWKTSLMFFSDKTVPEATRSVLTTKPMFPRRWQTEIHIKYHYKQTSKWEQTLCTCLVPSEAPVGEALRGQNFNLWREEVGHLGPDRAGLRQEGWILLAS